MNLDNRLRKWLNLESVITSLSLVVPKGTILANLGHITK